MKDASSGLLAAAVLSEQEEYLQNAAALDAEMNKLLSGIDVGLPPDVEQIADVVKKISYLHLLLFALFDHFTYQGKSR